VSAGARGVLAAADQIHARIADAEKLRAALEEIRRLHGTVTVDALVVCAICCLDVGGVRHDECVDSHEHTDTGPGCSTTEILARAGI
jgi:hypothetical protein